MVRKVQKGAKRGKKEQEKGQKGAKKGQKGPPKFGPATPGANCKPFATQRGSFTTQRVLVFRRNAIARCPKSGALGTLQKQRR